MKRNTKYTQKYTNKLLKRKQIFPKIIKINKTNLLDLKYNKISLLAKINKQLTEVQINKIYNDLLNIKHPLIIGKLKIIVLISPNKSYTKKGILVRQGGGKGKIIGRGLTIIRNNNCFEIIYLTKKNNSINNSLILNKFLKKYKFLKIFNN